MRFRHNSNPWKQEVIKVLKSRGSSRRLIGIVGSNIYSFHYNLSNSLLGFLVQQKGMPRHNRTSYLRSMLLNSGKLVKRVGSAAWEANNEVESCLNVTN